MGVITQGSDTPGLVHDDNHARLHGWQRWLYATKHKVLVTRYLWGGATAPGMISNVISTAEHPPVIR